MQFRGGKLGPLFLSLTLSSLGLGISLPIVTLFSVELGASAFMAGLIVSMRWLARLVVDIPVGVASERRGRRPLFIGGIVLAAISGFMSALAPDPLVLLLARVFEGVGAGMSTTVALAMVADVSDSGNRGRLMGNYQAIQRLGFWFGPAIGGVVAAAFDLRAALWVYAILATLAIIPALRVQDAAASEAEPAPTAERVEAEVPGAPTQRPSLLALMANRDVLLVSAVSFATFFTMTGTQFTVLPLFADDLHMGPDVVGWSLFASSSVGFVALWPTGILSDRGHRRGVVVVLAVIAAIGLLLLARVDDVLGILVASVLLGSGNALRGPATSAYVFDAGGRGNHGATAGIFRAIGDLGSTVGPVLAGLLLFAGPRAFFIVNAVLLALIALLFAWRASARPGEVASGEAETGVAAGAMG